MKIFPSVDEYKRLGFWRYSAHRVTFWCMIYLLIALSVMVYGWLQ